MDRVLRVWEVELQAVLDITKLGHRRRILHSIAGDQPTSAPAPDNGEPKATAAAAAAKTPATAGVLRPSNGTVPRTNHGKNRMAPQPPGHRPPPPAAAAASGLEIRTPAELLLGVPVGLQASWRHMPADLLAGRIQYEVYVSGFSLGNRNYYLYISYLCPVPRLDGGERAARYRVHAQIDPEAAPQRRAENGGDRRSRRRRSSRSRSTSAGGLEATAEAVDFASRRAVHRHCIAGL